MRRGLGVVTGVAFAILTLCMTANFDVWGPSYSPRHHLLEWTFFGAATYLFVTYRFARGADRERLVRAILVEGAVLFSALAAFLPYHVHHAGGPQPEVFWWDTPVPVTPFHEQLAIPGFVGLVLAPLILLVALRAQRAAVRPQLL